MNYYDNNHPLPYPSTENVKSDQRFARMLYGSYIDELKAISQYIYNEIMFDGEMNELAGIFEHLAETEMVHFHLLGETLKKLGMNPTIRTQIRTDNIDLIDKDGCKGPVEAERIINSSMQDERNAADEYTRLISYTNDPAVKAILARIAEDEKHHYSILKSYQL